MTESSTFVTHESGAVSLIGGGPDFTSRITDQLLAMAGKSAHFETLIEKTGISPVEDPVGVLASLPVTEKTTYRNVLREEALLEVGSADFITDFSSGSTAEPVIRIARPADELGELAPTIDVFARAFMKPSDRFVCLDVGAPEIYDFYFRAARCLGVSDVHYLQLTADWQGSIETLERLRPTILLTTPSLLTRLWGHLGSIWAGEDCPVRVFIAIGEHIDPAFRTAIKSAWGCQVMSFYGTTELGSFAGECIHEDGHHFSPELVIPTIEAPTAFDGTSAEGEVVFTALNIHTQSVIKYRAGDIVRLSTEPCECGDPSPRLWFLRRREEAFVIAGEKFGHSVFLESLRDVVPDLPLMSIEILDNSEEDQKAWLRITLPDQYRNEQDALLDALREGIFELDSLYRYGLVDFQLRFEQLDLLGSRKHRTVIDRRKRKAW